MAEKTQTAIVLQGGGAIGAYHLGVLRRLYEQPGFSPDIVTGVSIGAITAATVVGARSGDPIAELEALWRDFTVASPFLTGPAEKAISAITNFGMYRPRTDWWNARSWTSLMTTEPLRRTLAKRVDFDRLNASPIGFAVSAVNVATGDITYFTNREGPAVRLDDVVASGSLPPGFPMTRIDGQHYWDGGLFDNTPLQPALDMLDPDPAVRKRVIVVALFPRSGKVPTNFAEVADRMIDLQFADRMAGDLARLREMKALAEVMATLDAEPKSRLTAACDTFREAQEATYVHDIVEIVNEHPEVASGASDFSAPAIERRIAAGYADAGAVLGESAKAA